MVMSELNRKLCKAVDHKDLEEVKRLLDKGANLRVRDNDGLSLLHRAACPTSKRTASIIVTGKPDTNELPENEKLMIEFLLDKELTMEAGDRANHTPLFWAVIWNDVLMAEFLISKGAKVNAQRDGGDTPLHMAARNNDVPMIAALLRLGADPGITNDEKQKPEDLTDQRGIKEILRSGIRDKETTQSLKERGREVTRHAPESPGPGRVPRRQRH